LSVKDDNKNCCSNQASVLNCNGKTTMKNVASELLNSFEKLSAEMVLFLTVVSENVKGFRFATFVAPAGGKGGCVLRSSVVEIMSQDTTESEVPSTSIFQRWVFPNREELHNQMVKLNMAKKDERRWRTQNIVQIRYRCKEIRKFPYCDAYFTARCDADGSIESYGGVVHNHSYRKPTTRLPSPVRAKALQCLEEGVTEMATINNILIRAGYKVPQKQLRCFVDYHIKRI
ncbi:hypothetical protein T11_1258, partial [Trichinella zimbabwensis]